MVKNGYYGAILSAIEELKSEKTAATKTTIWDKIKASHGTNHKAFRVDQDPFFFDRRRRRRLGGLHQRLHGANSPE